MVTSTPVIATTAIPVPTSTFPSMSSDAPFPSTVAPSPTPVGVTDPPTDPTTTVFGDPHFSVLLPNNQRLCYTVQGEHSYSFNLISNRLLQMNARFIPDPIRDEVTWIGSLGIVVKGKMSNVTRVRFEAADKTVHIGDKLSLHVKKIDKLTFSNGKLVISEAPKDRKARGYHLEVELVDIGIHFWVEFVKDHLDMSWYKVGKQPPKSHGIIGEFIAQTVNLCLTLCPCRSVLP